MPNINRDVDKTSQREPFPVPLAATATGVTGNIACVPYAASLDFVNVAAFGISNVPTIQLWVSRFIAGTGSTVFAIGSTHAIAAFATSGPLVVPTGSSVLAYGLSGPQIGSTLATLFAGDVLSYQIGGTNAAFTGGVITAVLRPISDIVKYYNTL